MITLDSKDYISASEISTYVFCNVSWYMDREGYQRSSFSGVRMKKGSKSHATLKWRYNLTRFAAALILLVVIAITIFIYSSLQ